MAAGSGAKLGGALAMGVAFAVVFGFALRNWAIGIALGCAFFAIFAAMASRKNRSG